MNIKGLRNAKGKEVKFGNTRREKQTQNNRPIQTHFNESPAEEDAQVAWAFKNCNNRIQVTWAIRILQLRDSRERFNAGLMKHHCPAHTKGLHGITEAEEELYLEKGPSAFPKGHVAKILSSSFNPTQRQMPLIKERFGAK